MDRPAWVPERVDLERASVARVYDYNLGGAHNFAVDREVAEQLNAVIPDLPLIQRANRSFLRRAVRFLSAAGIRQFLDLGSGIPTVGNVHEIAQRTAPESRVVYVDVDPVAVAHGQALLAGNERVVSIQADLREPDKVLADPQVRRVLDFTAPMAVLTVAVLHFVADDEDPEGVVGRYRDAVVPGSFLVISHATQEGEQRQRAEEAMTVAARNKIPGTLRDRGAVGRLFAGFELVEPGLVYTTEWRPEPDTHEFDGRPERAATLAGVGVRS
jgi:S-adenosyl methyltransferase